MICVEICRRRLQHGSHSTAQHVYCVGRTQIMFTVVVRVTKFVSLHHKFCSYQYSCSHCVSLQGCSMNLKINFPVRGRVSQFNFIRRLRNCLNANLKCCLHHEDQAAAVMAGHLVVKAINQYGVLLVLFSQVTVLLHFSWS